MTAGDVVFRRLQATARSAAAKAGVRAPTQEYLIRHVLESFLDRLTHTDHAESFVLKGGILLAAYGVRRPTKDVDVNAISADITAEHITHVVRDIAAVETEDGLVFDTGTITVHQIRDQVEYPGLRVRVKVAIGPWKSTASWDVSTGDPIVPAPRRVRIERVLGPAIELLGYAPETTIAEKAVTILERGVTSTRWRDYVDIVQLAQQGVDNDELLRSARTVARYRGVTLQPVTPYLSGYGEVGQANSRMAAQRRTRVRNGGIPGIPTHPHRLLPRPSIL